MSRITDTERGARIAQEMARERLLQPDLFPGFGIGDLYFWRAIKDAADATLNECHWAREVTAQA